jgi:TonB family protein
MGIVGGAKVRSDSRTFRQTVESRAGRLSAVVSLHWNAVSARARTFQEAAKSSRLASAFAFASRRLAIDKLSRRQLRLVAAVGAIGAQAFLVLMLAIGSRTVLAHPPDVTEVTISGPWGDPNVKTRPQEVQPEFPTITPPEIQISDTVDLSAADTPGLPNVTRPAEAVAAAHMFPSAPAAYRSGGPHSVVVLLSVSEGGAVSAAAVMTSSGVAALDAMALDWVKKRWRYLPALRNGIPVSVTTTAVVTFLNA